MKQLYEKTVTTVFIVPTLNIDREDLYNNKLINGFIADVNKEDYYQEDVVFLLFKPNNMDVFRAFLEKEYEINSFIIEDYDYEAGYIVLVYQLNPELKKDIELIKQSKYSKVSDHFKSLFPLRLIDYSDPKRDTTMSIQHLVFDKDKRLLEFWESQLGGEDFAMDPNAELWNEFNLKNEILDIETIIENEKNNK